jgi:hypothetical protein
VELLGWHPHASVDNSAHLIIDPQGKRIRALFTSKQAHAKDIMKKTFQLQIEGKNRDRVLEATKHEIRQYIKRERRKPLPEGVDFWDFDCKFGATPDAAEVIHPAKLTELIDALSAGGGAALYLELLAKPGHRQAKDAAASQDGESDSASE